MTEKYNVVLIGAGNIGSRHAQSLVASDKQLNLVVIDPASTSLDLCRSRIEEIKKQRSNISVEYTTSFNTLPEKIDLAIIATSSLQRLEALKILLSRSDCKCLILEKFLFSKLEEYDEAEELIAKYPSMKVYVNCVKRTFKAYRWLHEVLNSLEGKFKMTVFGKNWGLAGNCIHYMDLFSYLSGNNITMGEFKENMTHTTESKRAGYIEVSGACSFLSDNGDALNVISEEGNFNFIEMKFQKNEKEFLIVECDDKIEVTDFQGKKKMFEYPFQSGLTSIYFNEFLEKNEISLPRYHESALQHKLFLLAINKLLKSKNYYNKWQIT